MNLQLTQQVLRVLRNNYTVSSTITASSIAEVQTTGNDNFGGFFDPTISGGVDYTNGTFQQLITFGGVGYTAIGTGSIHTIQLIGYTVRVGDVGNCLNIIGGSYFYTGRSIITSVNVSLNTWTLNNNVSVGLSASGMIGYAGGALGTLSGAYAIISKQQLAGTSPFNNVRLQCYVKAGTYNLNASNAFHATLNADLLGFRFIMGYTNNRIPYNNDVRPVFQSTGNNLTIFYDDISSEAIFGNIEIQNPSNYTNIIGFDLSANFNIYWRLNVANCAIGFNYVGVGGTNTFLYCSTINCNAGIARSPTAGNNLFYMCSLINSGCFTANIDTPAIAAAQDQTTDFYTFYQETFAVNCLVTGGTGGFTGFSVCINCVAYGVTNSSFNAICGLCYNCIADGSSGYGFNGITDIAPIALVGCATFGYSTPYINYSTVNVGNMTTLGSDPFTTPNTTVTADFTVTSGSGLQNAATPIEFPGLTSLTFEDVGCIRHQDPEVTPQSIAQIIWQDLLTSADFSTSGSIGALLKANINAPMNTIVTNLVPPTNFSNLDIDTSGHVILQPTGFDSIIAWHGVITPADPEGYIPVTARQAIFMSAAGVFGEVTGMSSGSPTVIGLDGLTTAAQVVLDSSGNRINIFFYFP
jgi:hypothetical protein